jgi:prepilin-type N-terminal cleavage/methylation domain-containing protein
MSNNLLTKKRGFSLLELLVAISIITMLSSVLLAAWTTAREKAQDARRLTELKQLKIAIELYHNDNGHYPRETDGANGRVGEGAGIDAMISDYLTSVPHDPAGPGHDTYYYYYDGDATCGGSEDVAVVFAFNMAQQTGNGDEYCTVWGGEGGSGTANAHHIVVGLTD